MARQAYPLEALRKLRDERARAATEQLARQVARSAAAAAAYRERVRLGREHAERTAEALSQEQRRLAQAPLEGADWQRAAEFAAAERARGEALKAAAEAARAALEREQAEEERLRAELGRLEAEAKLAQNHEQSFHERGAQAALQVEEETALEQWTARHR